MQTFKKKNASSSPAQNFLKREHFPIFYAYFSPYSRFYALFLLYPTSIIQSL